MARTVLNINRELLEEARQMLGTSTITDTVNRALAEVVAARKRAGFLDFLASRSEEDFAAALDSRAGWGHR
jgi:Arc/MetJ family transcription regulator